MKKYLLFLIFFSVSNFSLSQPYLVETVVSGLSQPVAFTFLSDTNVIITQKLGMAKIYSTHNTFISNFWNFTDSTVSNGERGLLGVCLDPNYTTNHFIYFYYNDLRNLYRVVRLTENNFTGTNPFIVFSDTGLINVVHVGGNIRFGYDNKLYITIGNNNVPAYSQSLNTLKGKFSGLILMVQYRPIILSMMMVIRTQVTMTESGLTASETALISVLARLMILYTLRKTVTGILMK